jgi:hypothetical protein
MLFSLEVLEKLRKKGKLSDATYNELLKAVEKNATALNKGGMVRSYAEGGVVQAPMTPIPQKASQAQEPAPAAAAKPSVRELFNQAMAEEQAAQASEKAAKEAERAARPSLREAFQAEMAKQQNPEQVNLSALRLPGSVSQPEAITRGKEQLANVPMVELEPTGMQAPVAQRMMADGQMLTNQFQQQANVLMADAAKGIGYAKAIDNAVRAKQEADTLLMQERDAVINEKNLQLQQKMDEYKSMQVDPSRFWANRSTGDKVMIGIGLALSGLGGSTKAVEVLQRAIDQDVNAQIANINKVGQEITTQRSVMKDMMDIYKDKSLAAEATKLASFQVAEAKIKEMSLKTQNQIQQLELSKLLGEIQSKQAETVKKLNLGLQNSGPVKDIIDFTTRLETIDNPEVRKQALQEYQTFKTLSSQLQQIDDIEKKFQPAGIIGKPRTLLENIPFLGRATQLAGVESPMAESIEQLRPRILNIIAEVAKQPITERTASLYDGFIPNRTDGPEAIAQKMQAFREFVRQGITSQTPTLSSLGMIPKQSFREGAPVK